MAGKVIETQELRERFQKVRVSVLQKQAASCRLSFILPRFEDL